MAKRRGNGEGAIYYRKGRLRKDGSRGAGQWVTSVSLGFDAKGKRRRRTLYGQTKQAVRDKLLRVQQDALTGLPVNPATLTVGQHFADWFRAKKATVRDSTLAGYRQYHAAYIGPAFDHMPLKSLDYRRINAWYEDLDAKGLSRRTVAYAAYLLRSALEDAVAKGLLPKNPAKLAARRTAPRSEARFLTQDEIRRFLHAAQGEQLEDAFALALYTGLRPGEWLGLPWDAVDLDGRKLDVRQGLVETGGRFALNPPKTKAGRRAVTLPAPAVDALRRQKMRQAEARLAAGEGWRNKWGLVFTDHQGGPLRKSNVRRRDLQRVLNKATLANTSERLGLEATALWPANAGAARPVKADMVVRLPDGTKRRIAADDVMKGVTLHTFRHTHASALIFQGADIKTVSRRLGHENITITLQTYGHLLPGQDERAADLMEDFMASI